MSWTTAATWTAGQVVGATDMNTQVRDNLNWLLSGRGLIYQRTSGNYTTTSTSVADVDGTNLNFSLRSEGTRVEVTVSGVVSSANNTGSCDFYIALDGVDSPSQWLRAADMNAGALIPFCFTYTVTVTAAAAHTYKLRWKTNGAAGTLTLYGSATAYANMSVKEIG